ncbi:thiamine ABC transporter, ATP-binding protein [Enterovibrio norvegicus FF-162]|uniref:thiamine ABC transporter ATP-binding protein n=1 Tax=Enterovibrio norvegicus TaxID=188144 RepID=UPI0002F1F62E|nr:thiamine ABC transporter ATP-binding protein [Enterovibrio norvegicus]OEE83538.1 thiamine ABC transporter, ATP-binding protein [Enterovibrio norvegicus FF-162]
MLKVSELSYHYQAQTLSFSFTSKPGSITAILGPSGAGKSTLLSLLCGLLPPSGGNVLFDDNAFTQAPAHERPLSILFQEHNLFGHLTVFDNIALGISPRLALSADDKKSIGQAAEQVGLESYLERLPGQLSGGQKQRVALARCLVRNRPLLLLDEPFSALDPSLRKDMLQQVKQLARQFNTTILMVTHHPEDAMAIADNVLFIDGGNVVYHADISELSAPNEIIKQYLS